MRRPTVIAGSAGTLHIKEVPVRQGSAAVIQSYTMVQVLPDVSVSPRRDEYGTSRAQPCNKSDQQ
ncbi:MAG: hypothetical protein ACRDI3_03755 [Actinomycetota bacterium]